MEELIQFDKQLLLLVNGSEWTILDDIVWTLTNAKTWIPLYLGLFYCVVRANNTVRNVVLILAAAGLCYLLAGAVDDGIVKPLVARWRPTHDPEIGMLVDVVNGYRGGNYGFFSAHASNTFSIAIFFSLLMRQRLMTIFLVCWSLINCWTRLYLGVHFPGDILVGLCWGAIVGYSVYRLYCRITIPAEYKEHLCYVPVVVFLLTLGYALCRASFITLL
jgi:undecaprenyl-diphosphatase